MKPGAGKRFGEDFVRPEERIPSTRGEPGVLRELLIALAIAFFCVAVMASAQQILDFFAWLSGRP